MINTEIYGDPTTWSSTQFVPFAKTVNYGTNILNAELTDGVNAGKTPVNELIENSICTAALGAESLYSNIIWEHNGELTHDNADYTPYFYANCYDSDGYIKTFGGINTNFPFYNAWKPFQSDIGNRQNKSLHSRVIGEYQPKKILYELVIGVCPANDYWNMHMYTIGEYTANTTLQSQYPKIFFAGLRAYFDTSTTETPNRELSAAVRLFGACINRELTPFTLNYNIDYMMCRGYDNYNSNTHIPLYGQPRTYITKGANLYNFCLAPESDISFDTNDIHIMHDNTPDFIEYLIRQAACFGVFVRISNDSGLPTSTIPLDNNDIICGVLVNGVGHGDYTRGTANRDNDIWEWQTNRDSNFDPYNPPDPTQYDTTTVFGSSGLLNTFVQYYALSGAGLAGLCDTIYNYVDSVDTDTEDINKAIAKTFYTNNPLDVIISLKRFPFDITQYSSITAQPQPVKLGNLSIFNITGYKLNGQYTVVDFGSYDCHPYFGNTFLDYAPYTYYELIIPFCGSTRIDPAVFMGHTLRLKMVVDLYTGACTCYILADNLCIDSVSGNCAIDIPITGIQSADFQNSVQNAITNVKNARINTAAYNMRGNLAMSPVWTGQIGGNALFKGGAAARIGNTIAGLSASLSSALHLGNSAASAQKEEAENYIANQKAEYDLQHVQTPFASVGSQSAANSYVEEMQARLIIYRPKFAADYDESVYAATEGHACLINGKVSGFTDKGLTIGNVKTNNIVNNAGMSPTAAEQAMLKNAFSTGVIL